MPVVVEWIREQYGRGKRFSSAAKLSQAAGWNRNLVTQIENDGYGSLESLIDIANAVGLQPMEMLSMAGVIDEPKKKSPKLSQDEDELVSLYRKAPHLVQRVVFGVLQEEYDDQ